METVMDSRTRIQVLIQDKIKAMKNRKSFSINFSRRLMKSKASRVHLELRLRIKKKMKLHLIKDKIQQKEQIPCSKKRKLQRV
jgi:hypothetical protein